ncbi:MAG: cysteine desulfurase family protein [Bacteroidota bacterium]
MESRHIYLDHAASSPMDKEVLDKMVPYLTQHFGNPSSTHAHGRALRTVIEQSRRSIATTLGVSPSEIFFTSGGTEADNTAIRGAVAQGVKHIITSPIEHHAVTHTVECLEKDGTITATYLEVDELGHISLEALEADLAKSPSTLVALMHGNNEIGTLYDLKAIGEICQKYDALFLSDTVQTMGKVEMNLAELPVHFATAAAHKFNGPKGVGFLYMQKGSQMAPLLCGGSQERNMRAGTENVAAIVGMAYAFEKSIGHLKEKKAHLTRLRTYMKERLSSEFPNVVFNGDQRDEFSLPNLLNVGFPSSDDLMLLFQLDIAGISASGGSACNSGAVAGSHVLASLGHSSDITKNSVRFSFGSENTIEEIDYVLNTLKSILKLPVNVGS